MVKARTRTTARKVKDKWKAKQWYTLLAPPAFNKVPICETPSEEPEKLMGRIATTTMQDLTGDFKLMHVKLDFQVERLNGTQAETRFIGHSLTSDYVRRLVRRNHSKISHVVDATTKDGALIRVKPIAVTEHRAQSTQQTLIRKIITDTVQESAGSQPLGPFVREMLEGRLTSKILKACKPIYPIRKLEMNKSEVRQAPTITIEDVEPPKTEGEPSAPGEGGDSRPSESEGPEGTTKPASDEPSEEEGGDGGKTRTEEGTVQVAVATA